MNEESENERLVIPHDGEVEQRDERRAALRRAACAGLRDAAQDTHPSRRR